MITVVVPVYNGEFYLEGFLENMRKQTRMDFCVFFIDDGSTDGTYERLLRAQKEEKFTIKVVHQENGGISQARNYGLSFIEDEYITFCDVDDGVRNDYFDCLYDLIEEYRDKGGVDLAVFESTRVMQPELVNGAIITDIAERKPSKVVTRLEMLERLASNPTRYGAYNLLIRRQVLIDNDLHFPDSCDYYEDYYYSYRIYSVCPKIIDMGYELYYYAQRPGSAVNVFRRERFTNIALLESLDPWFQERVPEFIPMFRKYVVSRVLWSLSWQAAVALSAEDFKRFAKDTDAKNVFKLLSDYPDPKVRSSALLFRFSPSLFRIFSRVFGKNRTKVKPVLWDDVKI